MSLTFKLRKEQVSSASKLEDLTLDEVKQYVIDSLYPPGTGTYIQLSEPDGTWNEAEDPEVKFPGTDWVQIFDSEGIFFRTEWAEEPTQYYKNNVLTPYRTNGLAEDKVQRMTGEFPANILTRWGTASSQPGMVKQSINHWVPLDDASGGANDGAWNFSIDSSHSPNAKQHLIRMEEQNQ